jgi:hypothetical protein
MIELGKERMMEGEATYEAENRTVVSVWAGVARIRNLRFRVRSIVPTTVPHYETIIMSLMDGVDVGAHIVIAIRLLQVLELDCRRAACQLPESIDRFIPGHLLHIIAISWCELFQNSRRLCALAFRRLWGGRETESCVGSKCSVKGVREPVSVLFRVLIGGGRRKESAEVRLCPLDERHCRTRRRNVRVELTELVEMVDGKRLRGVVVCKAGEGTRGVRKQREEGQSTQGEHAEDEERKSS